MLFYERHGMQVLFPEWGYLLLDEGLLEDLGEGHFREQRDDAGDDAGGGVFDDECEFECGLFHLDGGGGGGEACAVDDICPVEEVGEGGGVEAETGSGCAGDEAGAGDGVGVKELAVGFGALLALLKFFEVGRGAEGAFVVIEPPGEVGGGAVFEVDDGVFAGDEA